MDFSILQRPKGSENRIGGEFKPGRSGQASLPRASQLFSSAVKILIEHQTMTRKQKKTKEWKRDRRIILMQNRPMCWGRQVSYQNTYAVFRSRIRYFIDGGMIGTKAFVMKYYRMFRGHLSSRREKEPVRIKTLEGIYSLKRLSG